MGEPGGSNVPSPMAETIGHTGGTRGTETSKYPQEKKEISIFLVAASERETGQTEELAPRGCGPAGSTAKPRGSAMESAAKEGESPVRERREVQAGTRVPQDTRNPAGSRGDHPPSLNTIWRPIAHSTVRER